MEEASSLLVASRKRADGARLHCRVTPAGGYKLAIQRNQTHVGATGLVNILGHSISRQTVSRWEQLLAVNVLIQARSFYTGLEGDRFEFHSIRGDATNSGVGHHSLKVHAVAVDSRIWSEGKDPAEAETTHSVFPPLAEQPVHAGGQEIYKLYKQQLSRAAVPEWTDENNTAIRWYLFSTDQGADQVSCSAMVRKDVAMTERNLFSHAWCLDHVAHLIFGLSLRRFAGYWATVASFTNVFRASGNAIRIRIGWVHLFGAQSGVQIMKRLPPRPLKGRWGAVTSLEAWLWEGRAWRELPKVMASGFFATWKIHAERKPKP